MTVRTEISRYFLIFARFLSARSPKEKRAKIQKSREIAVFTFISYDMFALVQGVYQNQFVCMNGRHVNLRRNKWEKLITRMTQLLHVWWQVWSITSFFNDSYGIRSQNSLWKKACFQQILLIDFELLSFYNLEHI